MRLLYRTLWTGRLLHGRVVVGQTVRQPGGSWGGGPGGGGGGEKARVTLSTPECVYDDDHVMDLTRWRAWALICIGL